jgi:hypothetical protein
MQLMDQSHRHVVEQMQRLGSCADAATRWNDVTGAIFANVRVIADLAERTQAAMYGGTLIKEASVGPQATAVLSLLHAHFASLEKSTAAEPGAGV